MMPMATTLVSLQARRGRRQPAPRAGPSLRCGLAGASASSRRAPLVALAAHPPSGAVVFENEKGDGDERSLRGSRSGKRGSPAGGKGDGAGAQRPSLYTKGRYSIFSAMKLPVSYRPAISRAPAGSCLTSSPIGTRRLSNTSMIRRSAQIRREFLRPRSRRSLHLRLRICGIRQSLGAETQAH